MANSMEMNILSVKPVMASPEPKKQETRQLVRTVNPPDYSIGLRDRVTIVKDTKGNMVSFEHETKTNGLWMLDFIVDYPEGYPKTKLGVVCRHFGNGIEIKEQLEQ